MTFKKIAAAAALALTVGGVGVGVYAFAADSVDFTVNGTVVVGTLYYSQKEDAFDDERVTAYTRSVAPMSELETTATLNYQDKNEKKSVSVTETVVDARVCTAVAAKNTYYGYSGSGEHTARYNGTEVTRSTDISVL